MQDQSKRCSASSVKSVAYSLGFDLVGIAPVGPFPETVFYPKWLESGYADASEFETIQQRVRKEVDAATDEAERSPMPRPEDAALGLFAGDGYWETTT